jgi:hypothetical protein
MDPTPILCEIPPLRIFDERENIIKILPAPIWIANDDLIINPTKDKEMFEIKIEYTEDILLPHYVNKELYYKKLEIEREEKELEYINCGRRVVQNFQNIRSPFKLDGAIKLANIDAIFQVIPQTYDTLIYRRSGGSLNFGTIADGPGGFTEYLQYRYPESVTVGITLKNEKDDWDYHVINKEKFVAVYGKDLTGNILSVWKDYNNYVTSYYSNGLDFVVCDVATENETIQGKILLIEAIMALKCIKMGRDIVIRLSETYSRFTCQILFIISQCFEKSYIFKPITTKNDDSEKYFIGKRSLYKKLEISKILERILDKYEDGKKIIKTFLKSGISNEFKETITKFNDLFLENQVKSMEILEMYMKSNKIEQEGYDIRKCLSLWNLPDYISEKNK